MRVLITDYQWPDLKIEKKILQEIDAEIVLPESTEEQALIQAAKGCDAIMTCWAQTTSSVIESAGNCQIVARMGIGLDNIDLDYCTSRQIPVTNVPDYCLVEVAEHVLASIFALARKIPFFHRQSGRGIYDLSAAGPFRRVKGQTLGILGLGNIGSYLAKIAQGAGLEVIACSRSPKSEPGVKMVSLDQLLEQSDFLSINAPLTPKTENLFNADAFEKMKPTAYLINTSRGGLVDHGALANALTENQLAGALLDVQVPEPPDLNCPPYCDDRVVITPHAAFVSEESLSDLRTRASRQVVDRLTGKVPESIVNGIRI